MSDVSSVSLLGCWIVVSMPPVVLTPVVGSCCALEGLFLLFWWARDDRARACLERAVFEKAPATRHAGPPGPRHCARPMSVSLFNATEPQL